MDSALVLHRFPRDQWPDNIPLLFYCYHIMVGLGTIFIAELVIAGFLLWRKRLFETRWILWLLMVTGPFPFIAYTAGWITAEVGRQPWVVFGLMRTAQGFSHTVSAGNALFTLLGFLPTINPKHASNSAPPTRTGNASTSCATMELVSTWLTPPLCLHLSSAFTPRLNSRALA